MLPLKQIPDLGVGHHTLAVQHVQRDVVVVVVLPPGGPGYSIITPDTEYTWRARSRAPSARARASGT